MAGLGEVIARLKNGSLLICEGVNGKDGCGGEGYTDGGTTCCALCLGTGLTTPELLTVIRDERKFRDFTVQFIGIVDDLWEDDDVVDLPALRGLADTARVNLRSLFEHAPEVNHEAE